MKLKTTILSILRGIDNRTKNCKPLFAHRCILALAIPFALLLTGCEKKLPVYTEEVHITIPGMEDEVKLAFLSDLHIITLSDEIDESQKETVAARVGWSSYEGVSAKDQWPGWVDTLNLLEADYILFGGDMVDVPTLSNIEALKAEISRLNKPYMYIRADHDQSYSPYLVKDLTDEKTLGYQNSICEVEDVYIKEFDDFIIVGWNLSTSLITPEGLDKIKTAAATGKPLILLTHVPIQPLSDESLSEKSKEVYQDRALIWGKNPNLTFYFPTEDTPNGLATGELLDMIYAEDSPFVEVLCGHLHFSWDGQLTEKVHQHVFSAAFDRYMGLITISGN